MNYLKYMICFLVEKSRKMNVDIIYTCPNMSNNSGFDSCHKIAVCNCVHVPKFWCT